MANDSTIPSENFLSKLELTGNDKNVPEQDLGLGRLPRPETQESNNFVLASKSKS